MSLLWGSGLLPARAGEGAGRGTGVGGLGNQHHRRDVEQQGAAAIPGDERGHGPSLVGLSADARCAGGPMRVGGRGGLSAKIAPVPGADQGLFLARPTTANEAHGNLPCSRGMEGTGTSHVGLVHFCLPVYTIC